MTAACPQLPSSLGVRARLRLDAREVLRAKVPFRRESPDRLRLRERRVQIRRKDP
jgi:hypothetical protein